MKLELVMLITAISMITERLVDAQLECYENRDGSGTNVKITDSISKLKKKFPNGPKACKVSPKYVAIFYSEENYFGEINTVYSINGEMYRPRKRFIPRSVLIIGKSSSHPKGLFLFQQEGFGGGVSKNFIEDNENVRGGASFQSAIVIGPSDWTIVRDCEKSDCERECLSCLQGDKDGGASFIPYLKIGHVLEKTTSVFQGSCLGTNYTGRSSIPECPCNPHGVVDGPDKCKGNNGICQCKPTHTGDDCDSCKSKAHTWREGKCVAGCGCNPKGVYDKNNPCYRRRCSCNRNYGGRKCEECSFYSRKTHDGSCVDALPCVLANLRKLGYSDWNRYYNRTTGRCKCKPNYQIGHCDRCAKGYYEFKPLRKCFNKAQFEKVKELEYYYNNNIGSFYSILDDLGKLGLRSQERIKYEKKAIRRGWKTLKGSAKDILSDTYYWEV